MSDIERYMGALDEMVGGEAERYRITQEGERPAVWVFIYRDVPEPGHITAFTYGLSSVDHPEWKEGRPELVLSVRSSSEDWALAAGEVVRRFRGQSPFSYGATFSMGERITGESSMTSFLVFAPNVLEPAQAHLELAGRTLNFVQLYPIYESERHLLARGGADKFFARPGLDLFDVARPNAAAS